MRRAVGFFISFEGAEASGKSTQIERLAARLTKLRYSVLAVREPGGTALGEEIRRILQDAARGAAMAAETELLLFNASRAQLVREKIQPALAGGAVVLADRFSDSTLAYQGYGRGLTLERLRPIIACATGGLQPNLTLLIHIPFEKSLERQRSRQESRKTGPDRLEQEEAAFFRRVEAGYRALADAEPGRIQWIDGSAVEDEVEERIWTAVQRRLPARLEPLRASGAAPANAG